MALNPNKKVRVAMFSNLYPPLATGSAIQSSGLAKRLASLGYEPIVITAQIMRDSPSYEESEGVKIYRLPCFKLPRLGISMNFPWLNSAFSPRNIQRIKEILIANGTELIHIHNHMFDMALCGVWIGKKLNMPTVVTIHTVIQHTRAIYNLFLKPIDSLFLGRLVIRKASKVICPDCTVEKYLRDRFKNHEGHIIPYGVEPPPIPASAEIDKLRERWGLKSCRVILSLGHLHALRNRLELIKGFAMISSRMPDVRLLIVGSCGFPPSEKLVGELGLEGKVIFTGAQPHELVPAFHMMAECEAAWLDQKNMASAGVACLEAMYYGKPVITACPEDTHEEGGLVNGKNVIILPRPPQAIDVQDALLRLLENKETCDNIGRNAKAFVRSYFSWDQVVQKHVELYEAQLTDKS